MNREELIGLRKQVQKAIKDGYGLPTDVLSAQIVLVFEQAHTPTDDEPVAYGIYGRVTGNLKYVQVMDEQEVVEQSEFYDVVPLFRRPVQGEPTDAQVEAALNAYDPQAATDDDVADWGEEHVADMRAALRAALAAGREEGQ